MKLLTFGMATAVCLSTAAVAQTVYYPLQGAGRPAYSDTWNGGTPYPPIGQTTTYYGQPLTYTYTPAQVYVRPRTYVSSGPFLAYEPSAMGPIVPPGCGWGINCTRSDNVHPGYYRGASVVTGGHYVQQPTYSTQYVIQAPAVGSVQAPAHSRCIAAILNAGGPVGGVCSDVRISRSQYPYLRQKFSNYRPNSGYALNLPSDDDYR